MRLEPRATVVTALVFAAGVVWAGDPDTDGCTRALAELDRAQDQLLAARSSDPGGRREDAARDVLEAQRAEAARRCVGGSGRAEPGARWPPASGLSPRPADLPHPLPVLPVPAGRPPPVGLPAPTVPVRPAPPMLMGCDAAGCWSSEGRWLPRAGPNQLLSPRGLCSQQGTLLQCP